MKKITLLFVLAIYSVMLIAQDKKMSEIKIDQLPKGVSTWVGQNAAGSKIIRAAKMEEKGVLSYIAVLDMKGTKHAFQFDKDGKYIGKADNLLKGQQPPATKVQAAPAGTNTDPKQQGTPVAKPPVKTQDTKATTTEEAPKK
jgi:hypothetical protein